MKIIIINHTFQKPHFYKRWQKLSEMHDNLDVTLLAPTDWMWSNGTTLTYGKKEFAKGKVVEGERFRIHLIDTKVDKLGEWSSKKLEDEVKSIKPDFVYFIGGYTTPALMQLFRLRKKEKMSNMKILAFSMRGHTPTVDFKRSEKGFKKYIRTIGKALIWGPRLKKFNKECDAVFCHYPAAIEAFRKEGFKKPIYMQTQVGVDPDIFYFDEARRKKIREKYNIADSTYVFGSATRFNRYKGLIETVRALPEDGDWKYLMMGWGRNDEVEDIKNVIAERGLQDKIILTGFIDNWEDMAEHWCALDCAVHFPSTTLRWEETFSLALVQAMITGLPVIGSDSGSVPYQIGPDGIVLPEGDIAALNTQMVYMMQHRTQGAKIGEKMKERAMKGFNIYHLNELFYRTLLDIENGVYDERKIDMTKYTEL